MADDQYDPDPERVQNRSIERDDRRTDHVEAALEGTGAMLDEHKYPTTGEELATEYADQELDLANETESLGDVFDRLVDERFESAEEAREAVYGELTGRQAGAEEYADTRDLDDLDEAESEPE